MSGATVSWSALGTTATVVVTDPAALVGAQRAVEEEVEAIDRACSRFRDDDDAELVRVHAAEGAPIQVSALLCRALAVALDAARRTGGIVDPTVGAAMIAAGYDRDFAALPFDAPARPAAPIPGWRTVHLDRARRIVQLEPGTRLDLGATAKALAADRAAVAAAAAVAPHGVLVSLGGDVAVAGPAPRGGWPVGVADAHTGDAETTVAVDAGGIATSSVTQRRWRRGGAEAHHVLDPRTGEPAPVVWRTVTVKARSCVEANTATTAAIVLGEAAPTWLAGMGLPARLVRHDGAVLGTAGWPLREAVTA